MEKAVTDFHEELKNDFKNLNDKIEIVRGKILSRIEFDGCLRGTVDDYMDKFEMATDKMNKKLSQEKRYWYNQARSINLLKAKQESQLKQLLAQHQKEITSLLQTETPAVVQLTVKQMPMIGKPIKKQQINFRWPTDQDLIKHDLETPPQLIAVNSKGVERSELTGI